MAHSVYCARLTEDGAPDEPALYRLSWLEAVLAAEDAQFAVVIADKLEFTKSLTATVAEVSLAARARHVITAGTSLDVELRDTVS